MPPADPLKTKLDPIFTGQKPAGESAPASVFNVLNNQKYSPSTPPITMTPAGVPENNTLRPKSSVRTYKDDVEAAMQAGHMSSINIAVAENERMHNQIKQGIRPAEEAPAESSAPGSFSKTKIFLFISFILIMAGLVSLGALYWFNKKNPAPVVQNQELPSLITTEYKDELNSSLIVKDKFVLSLAGRLNDIQIPVNNLYSPYITTGTSTSRRLVNASELVSLLGFKMPDILKRSLLPDFMAGVFSFDKNHPFLIFKISSFENAYAGLLQWEAGMEKDFRLLFRLPGFESGTSIIADLTPTSQKTFADAVIVNKDVRLLRNDAGEIMLLYGIIDKETVIITVSDTAFKEIINRLNKEKSLMR